MQSIVISVSVCLSVRPYISKITCPNFTKSFAHVTVAVVRSFSDDIAICYVLPVLWMTSCFYVMERTGQNQRRRACFVQFTRWQHKHTDMLIMTLRTPSRGEVLIEPNHIMDATLLVETIVMVCDGDGDCNIAQPFTVCVSWVLIKDVIRKISLDVAPTTLATFLSCDLEL